ncbi:MAG: glycerol-3-phosphate 1-O-acyltransferase PlsY [Pyrinomonadaceae bacterium]
MVRSLLVVVIAYLLGSIPFGYLIVRVRKGSDVRAAGSGATGATNVSRQAGKAFGVLTLILDAAKGAGAVLIAKLTLGLSAFVNGGQSEAATNAEWVIAGAAVAVIVGHCFPVWLGFRGGKGVATGLGVFLVLAPIAAAMAAVVFVLTFATTRYVSLGSILAAATIPLFVCFASALISHVPDQSPLIVAAIVGAALIIFAHRANIRRLLEGAENKF